MGMVKKRLDWADLVKGFGMFVVVFSHYPHPEWINAFYTPFFLAIFFFVSGYFFSPKRSFGEFVVNKFWKLLVPLFMFGALGVLESVLLGGESLVDRLAGLFIQIAGWNDTMWFFSCLFTVELVFYWVHKVAGRLSSSVWPLVALSAAVIGLGVILCRVGLNLPWHFETACVVELFFLGGHLCRRYAVEEKVSLPLCLGAWILFIVFVRIFPNPVDMHLDRFGNIVLFFLQSLLSVYAFMCLCVLLSGKRGRINDFIIWVGQNTVQYFFFQGVFITVVTKLLSLVGVAAGSPFVMSLLCTALIYIVLCIPAYIVRRFFPIFLGKR